MIKIYRGITVINRSNSYLPHFHDLIYKGMALILPEVFNSLVEQFSLHAEGTSSIINTAIKNLNAAKQIFSSIPYNKSPTALIRPFVRGTQYAYACMTQDLFMDASLSVAVAMFIHPIVILDTIPESNFVVGSILSHDFPNFIKERGLSRFVSKIDIKKQSREQYIGGFPFLLEKSLLKKLLAMNSRIYTYQEQFMYNEFVKQNSNIITKQIISFSLTENAFCYDISNSVRLLLSKNIN